MNDFNTGHLDQNGKAVSCQVARKSLSAAEPTQFRLARSPSLIPHDLGPCSGSGKKVRATQQAGPGCGVCSWSFLHIQLMQSISLLQAVGILSRKKHAKQNPDKLSTRSYCWAIDHVGKYRPLMKAFESEPSSVLLSHIAGQR